ncbi:MAG: hypothetical protein AAF961_06855, partial [Planctomycetota bacterium]
RAGGPGGVGRVVATGGGGAAVAPGAAPDRAANDRAALPVRKRLLRMPQRTDVLARMLLSYAAAATCLGQAGRR